MFIPQWFARLFPRRAPKTISRYVRLSLEGLEDRLTPSGFNPLVSPSSQDGPGIIALINPASSVTTTTAQNATASFSSSLQSVTLSATVTSSAGIVNEGTVSFSVLDSKGDLLGATAVGGVSNGAVSVNYSLPGATPVGVYTIEADYSDSSGSFGSSSDNTHTLTINALSTTTTANNATTNFRASAQNVALSASVSSSNGPVNEGTVTFTLLDDQGNIVGTATSGSVSNGTANASYTLPAGTPVSCYTIVADYSDSTNNFGASSDNTHTLTVLNPGQASTTTTASSVSTTFNDNPQTVTMKATVASGSGTVNEGNVTFTILQGGTVVGSAVSGAVSNGAASVSYTLPAGLSLGSYTIAADYSDGTSTFAPSSDNSHALTVTAASTTTTANSLQIDYSSSAQNVTLTADVKSTGGTVSEGSVLSTLLDSNGKTIGSPTSGAVSNGQAAVSYALPAGLPAGSYTIVAAYSDNSGDFSASSDNTHTLTVLIVAAPTTTTANNATTAFSESTQIVTLSATVTSPDGTVNKGNVTFTIFQGAKVIGSATSGAVTNGTASVSYTLPAGTALGTYTIADAYSDSSGNFSPSSDNSHTLTVTAASDSIAPDNVTVHFNANTQSVTLTADMSSEAGPINEGSITFAVLENGAVLGTATSGTVSNGQAAAAYVLPAGLLPGNYTIDASYSDPPGRFTSGMGMGTLSVVAPAATVQLTSVTIVPNLFTRTAQVTLTAQVNNPLGGVNEGAVTFTFAGVSAQGGVVNGTASAQMTVPLLSVIGNQMVTMAYADNGIHPFFGTANGTAAVALNWFNALGPATVSFTADGGEQNVVQTGIGPVEFDYANQQVTEVRIGGFALKVNYVDLGGGRLLVTLNGVPWEVKWLGPQGQVLGVTMLVPSDNILVVLLSLSL